MNASAARPLTPAMRRELRSMAVDGNPSDPFDWSHAPEGLWFHARERVISALLRRGLIETRESSSGYHLTPEGERHLKVAS